ncbi:MAG: AIR synthase-related protein [Oligoflexia bacterium]|nr:AIR synthase-related protein [Oligoflexia bacterium]
MFARIEVAMRPEFSDPSAAGFLRKVELAHPEIRRKIRWARLLEVYWLELPASREELIPAITEVFWDRVLQWLFTGNLIPKAAGKHGGIADLLEGAPNRPGKFWAIERRFRPGVTDNVGRTAIEALEIVCGKALPEGRAASGSLVVLEGVELDEELLARVARDVLCNELIETWTVLPESELKNNDRFHPERIRRDIPRVKRESAGTSGARVEELPLEGLGDAELESLSQRRLLALSLAEMRAVRDYFRRPDVQAQRRELGLGAPTDVELEVIAQTWSEHCKHKIFGAAVDYSEDSNTGGKAGIPAQGIPARVESLFKATIAGTTQELPKPWLLSVFKDNAGIVAFDAEDAFCIKVETHNTPSALDPYGGALTGIVGVNRDILGCGLGARPIFNTDVFCVGPLDHSRPLPERILHPRRILGGIRQGVEHGGNKSGIPTVNGALVFDERYLGKPLVYCGTGGFLPRTIAGVPCETKEIRPGDRICMVGGRIGKDGIHGATFSSLALDQDSPVSAVQLGDPITQKRLADFLLEARDLGLYRAVTDNGAGGLSSSVGELATLSGGARMDVARARTKYPGLKPYELTVSESQERMTVAVPPERLPVFLALAERRGVEVSDLGEFNRSGRFDIEYEGKPVGSLQLEFLHEGVPRLELKAVWDGGPPEPKAAHDAGGAIFEARGPELLLSLMGRPNIASKEWLIRQYDHEVQGTSVVKPLHTVGAGTPSAMSGPNDAAVLKPKPGSDAGIAVACGINPKLSDLDPYLMAQAAVDEAVRNVLCVGAEFGNEESVLALVDNFCWPDPVSDPAKMAALVRACYGLREAALALSAPLVSGKDSMKNDFRGKLGGDSVVISVPPTLLMTAVARVSDIRRSRTADFKKAGDALYLLGGNRLGLPGSELAQLEHELHSTEAGVVRPGLPDWQEARRIYSWLGGAQGKEQGKLRSLHDVSEGGLLVAIAEGALARGLGAKVTLPADRDPWALAFGEGFHSFVATVSEEDSSALEAEWKAFGVPAFRLGSVTGFEKLEVTWEPGARSWNVPIKQLRLAWQKGGYWE